MPPAEQFYVYILTTAHNTTLYTGITNNLTRRVFEHKNQTHPGFTKTYSIHKLVYYELCQSPTTTIAREKQIKSWTRKKKIALIETLNSDWKDLWT